ncbi:MAG: glycosyltransferase family 4 protein [Flavobacteriaceae bacterium]|nr:glycosyltransferase family 4 protein [Flavobacteriaceae bacterium]
MKKLIRITTVPLSLEKLLENQPHFFSSYFDITLVSSDENSLSKIASEQGIKCFPLEMTRKITPLQDLRCLVQLVRFLRKEKPHFVHSHTPKAGIIGMLAAYIARVPVRMHTVAGMPLMEATGFKRRILNLVERITYFCATKVYPNSKGLQDFIIQNTFCKATKLKVLGSGSSNGIDTSYFDPDQVSENQKEALKKELHIKPTDYVYCFVGRLVKDKGVDELIEAFTAISDKNRAAKLILVGHTEADLDPLLPETLRSIEFNENIIEVGFQNDIRPYLSIAHVFTFPSYREGFPNVVLQANVMGIPCIVSDINGCNEIISSGDNGLIIPSKNSSILQEKMELISTDPNQIKLNKTEIRALIKTKFERKVFWHLLLEEYKALERDV